MKYTKTCVGICVAQLAIFHANAANPTIDRMYVKPIGGYTQDYSISQGLALMPKAEKYVLNDGSEWFAGAGWHPNGYVSISFAASTGSQLIFDLKPQDVAGILFQNTDYDSGDHSAQGTLIAASPITLIATPGSSTATAHGWARITANDETWYGLPRFNYYSAPVGALVPYSITYQLENATWQEDSFSHAFQYTAYGSVDFAHPGAVDLRVTAKGTNGRYNAGTISYQLMLENASPINAVGTTFTHEIQEGVEFSSFDVSTSDLLPVEFVCEIAPDNSHKLICDIETFGANRAYFIDIQVAAASPKMKYTFTSTLSTTDADSNLSDNTNTAKFGGSLGILTLVSGLALFLRRIRNSRQAVFKGLPTLA